MEKLKNITMLSAKEPVIRMRFFFTETAWLTPRTVSILPKRVLAARRGARIFFKLV